MDEFRTRGRNAEVSSLELARVLLVHGELAPRLTLQTILRAGGYLVDAAATPAEAINKLDESCYDLVLSDSGVGNTASTARNVLAYARIKDYHPATGVITSSNPGAKAGARQSNHEISIHTENVPVLLGKVAELIGMRATRRYRPLRQAV